MSESNAAAASAAAADSSAADAPSTPPLDPELPRMMSMREVLRISMMRRLWFAQIISIFGDFLALYAVIGVMAFRLKATASQVTGVQVAYLLPIAILGIVAGVFVDRWSLKTTMVSSDAIRAGLCGLLLFATQLWHFYAILAAISVVSSFFGPAQGVAIRTAVPLNGLRAANTLLQQVMFGMRIIGPGVAAFLVDTYGPASCYLADSASFVGSALLIASVAFIKVASPQTAGAPSGAAPAAGAQASALGKIWLDMKQGFDFIVHHPGMLFVILAMASGMFVIGCFGPLVAIYVRDDVGASTKVWGVASALIAVGMLVGMNLLAIVAKNVKSAVLVYSGLAGIAAGLCVLAALPYVWSLFIGDLMIGMAVAGIIIPAQTMIQQETPPALMGRVGSTTMSLVFGAQIAGLLLSGVLAAAFGGVRPVFAGCTVILLLLIAAGRLWMEPKGAPAAA